VRCCMRSPSLRVAMLACILLSTLPVLALKTVASIPLSGHPVSIDVNQITQRVYVSTSDNNFNVIDATSNVVVATIPVQAGILTVDEVHNMIYVNSFCIYAIDGATNTVVAQIPIGFTAGIAVNPLLNRVYSVDDEGDFPNVHVIDTTTYMEIADIPINIL